MMNRGAARKVNVTKRVDKNSSKNASTPASSSSSSASSSKAKSAQKPSKVLRAAEQAQSVLDEIARQECEEEEHQRHKFEQKISGGEIKWLSYIEPQNTASVADCARTDEYNRSVFEHNNAMLERVNRILYELGRQAQRVEAPTKYVPIAKEKFEKMLANEEFRLIKGIEYLADREMYPKRDYEIAKAPEIADDLAYDEEIERLKREANENGTGIDVTVAVGRNHAMNCTCENRWDGESEYCFGHGNRLRWKRHDSHHFLRPVVIPEKY